MARLRANIRDINDCGSAEVVLHSKAVTVDCRELRILVNTGNREGRECSATAGRNVLQVPIRQCWAEHEGRIRCAEAGNAALVAVIGDAEASASDGLVVAEYVPGGTQARLR